MHLSLPPHLSDSAARSSICLTLVAWMIHGTLGFRFLHFISFLDWALFGCGPSPSYLAHVPFCPVFMGWLVLLPCHCTALLLLWYHLSFYLVVAFRLTSWSSCQPMSYILSSFGLIGLYDNLMNLLIPFLGFPGPFYLFSISYNSHGFTTSFLGLPRPICFLPGHLLFLWA